MKEVKFYVGVVIIALVITFIAESLFEHCFIEKKHQVKPAVTIISKK